MVGTGLAGADRNGRGTTAMPMIKPNMPPHIACISVRIRLRWVSTKMTPKAILIEPITVANTRETGSSVANES